MEKVFVQITRAQSDRDRICITLLNGDDRPVHFHLRAEMTLDQFADLVTSGQKIECELIRNRIHRTV